MLPLPPFDLHHPNTAAEAVALLARLPGARLIAGGTDLVPNLKHGLHDAPHLVSLSRLPPPALHRVGEHLHLDAGLTIEALTNAPLLAEHAPGLAQAAAAVAGPLHRGRATLGGNVMLDTRCQFYNQTAEWRAALGHCLKREGDWCHVVGSAKTCVAAHCGDTVPMLAALDAVAVFLSPAGEHHVPVLELFQQDGREDRRTKLPPASLLTHLLVPIGAVSAFRKLRRRAAIDFPLLNLGIAAQVAEGRVAELRVVVGALLPRPRPLAGMEAAVGTRLEDEVIAALSAEAVARIRPQENLTEPTAWRREVAGVELARGLREIRALAFP